MNKLLIILYFVALFSTLGLAFYSLGNKQESVNTFITQDGIEITIVIKKEE